MIFLHLHGSLGGSKGFIIAREVIAIFHGDLIITEKVKNRKASTEQKKNPKEHRQKKEKEFADESSSQGHWLKVSAGNFISAARR